MKTLNYLLIIFTLTFFSCKNEKGIDLAAEIEAIENGLLPSIQVKGDSTKTYNLSERMEHYKIPGVSIAIVENGKIKWAKGYGLANTETGKKVDTNTIFQAGSISKPIAALSALKLVEEGKIDLDEDVNLYLKEWKIPDNKYTQAEKVTLRRLLTHTAGMTVHGFPGYKQTDTFPSITQVLDGAGNTPRIFVDTIPESLWRYSGGGYTVMEKMVEDMSGLPFDVYSLNTVLQSIGMENSTFKQPITTEGQSNISAAYDGEGKIIEGLWHNYPEKAAAGLWTTPTDLAKYCIEIQQILKGKEDGVLSKESVEKMITKHKNDWGLGPSLQWEQDSLIFRHGGKNAGFTNELVAFAYRENAVIIMTNADNGGRLIGELLRSISKYYNWGFSAPRVIETVNIPLDTLNNLIGKYKLDFQVPDIGDYVIDITIEDNKLFITDPNNGETKVLTAIEDLKFIDLESGEEFMFQPKEDKQGMLWNNRFQFYKIQD